MSYRDLDLLNWDDVERLNAILDMEGDYNSARTEILMQPKD